MKFNCWLNKAWGNTLKVHCAFMYNLAWKIKKNFSFFFKVFWRKCVTYKFKSDTSLKCFLTLQQLILVWIFLCFNVAFNRDCEKYDLHIELHKIKVFHSNQKNRTKVSRYCDNIFSHINNLRNNKRTIGKNKKPSFSIIYWTAENNKNGEELFKNIPS